MVTESEPLSHLSCATLHAIINSSQHLPNHVLRLLLIMSQRLYHCQGLPSFGNRICCLRNGNCVENHLTGEDHQPLGQCTQSSLKRLARVSKNVIRCGDGLKQMRDKARCFTTSFSKQRTSEEARWLGEVRKGGFDSRVEYEVAGNAGVVCVILEILAAGEVDVIS